MVEGADIDVVDVEQKPATGASRQLADEFPLGHLRLGEGDVGRHILDGETPAEEILHVIDAIDDVVERLLGVGHGQEVVQVHPMDAGPAEMIGDPFGLNALGEGLQSAQIVHVEWSGRGDRQRNAVHDDRIALADPIQHVERLAAFDHVVLGNDLEPVDGRLAVEDLLVMLRPKTQAKTQIKGLLGNHAGAPRGVWEPAPAGSHPNSLSGERGSTPRSLPTGPACRSTRSEASRASPGLCKHSCPCSHSWSSCNCPGPCSR